MKDLNLKDEKMIEGITLFGERSMVPVSSLKPRISVYIVLHNEHDYLLVPHKQNGLYGCPGGEVNPGETHLEALKRECREEIGTDEFRIVPWLGPSIAENILILNGENYQTHMIYYYGDVDRSLVKDTDDEFEGPPMWIHTKDLKPEQFPFLKVNSLLSIVQRYDSYRGPRE